MFAFLISLVLLPVGFAPTGAALPASLDERIEEFELSDYRGAVHKLSDWRDSKVVVVAFLGAECPLAERYAPRLNELTLAFAGKKVSLIGINANEQDGVSRIEQYVRTYSIKFPILKDVGNVIADRFGAERTPEVFVLDSERFIRYRGRIDDQYGVGVERQKATSRDLANAIEDVLAGRPVRVPVTTAVGCRIGRVVPTARAAAITYYKDILPILQERCINCHRTGGVAPFSLTSYKAAAGWSDMIQEVLAEERMPPWHANPKYGKFSNDPRMTDGEKQRVYRWIAAGATAGDPGDAPPPRVFSDTWRIGHPDLVLSMPEPFHLPAEGIIDYQYFEVDPGFKEDKWIQAADVLPGNRSVVHHCLIYLRPPGSKDLVKMGPLGSVWLTGVAAGSPPLILPKGMAKRVPAGWKLVFQMHYTTNGAPQTDQTRLGLIFADPKTVQREVATNMALNLDIRIPARAGDHLEEASATMPDDVLLLALSPHMHLRGKSFRYEAVYPDGKKEILLDVPHYDYAWQHTYELAEPKLLPRGTTMHCLAHFDNSANNSANPNPDVDVTWGLQSWDEMMIGYYDIALADQDLTRSGAWNSVQQMATRSPVASGLIASGIAFLIIQRVRRRRPRPAQPASLATLRRDEGP
jgi:peroxiredoxin